MDIVDNILENNEIISNEKCNDYRCGLCDKTFSEEASLGNHILTIFSNRHPGRNFIPTPGGVLVKWVGIKFLPGWYASPGVGTKIPTWVPITKNRKNKYSPLI